jgi:N-acetylglutamate synthase-like GNAT family acetyltransferase
MSKTEMPVWSIRRATTQDRQYITELQERLNRPLRSDSVTCEYFVAVNGRQIVGCAAVRKRGNVGYLYGLAVDKPWRRQGIGHALTQTRLEWLRNEQVRSAFVMAMFWNIRFFRKHGFILTKRRTMGAVQSLHSDFSDAWSRRSALLFLDLLDNR